jgi:hypothetical protein
MLTQSNTGFVFFISFLVFNYENISILGDSKVGSHLQLFVKTFQRKVFGIKVIPISSNSGCTKVGMCSWVTDMWRHVEQRPMTSKRHFMRHVAIPRNKCRV